MELLDTVMRWIVAPLAGFVALMYNKQQEHSTSIAVLKSQLEASKATHEKEYTETRESLKYISSKLDNIETALRK